MVAGLMPNFQPGGPGFSLRVVSLSQKVSVLRHRELNITLSALLYQMMQCPEDTTWRWE